MWSSLLKNMILFICNPFNFIREFIHSLLYFQITLFLNKISWIFMLADLKAFRNLFHVKLSDALFRFRRLFLIVTLLDKREICKVYTWIWCIIYLKIVRKYVCYVTMWFNEIMLPSQYYIVCISFFPFWMSFVYQKWHK